MDFGTGQAGEKHIAKLLKHHGYRILEQNYHSRFGEIDIIAENDQYIVFVEVKTREKGGLVAPFEAITPEKQRRLILTAEDYLAKYNVTTQPRFDAAAVYTERGKIVGEEYLENAFGVG
ncbi:YraN family protein [uncultured Neglectibacter sp.]|uniref:YraN family protein n=1 Tax=uncultured Neglectibacter sp. TaxID=1924108 RepID=UPI0034DEB89C